MMPTYSPFSRLTREYKKSNPLYFQSIGYERTITVTWRQGPLGKHGKTLFVPATNCFPWGIAGRKVWPLLPPQTDRTFLPKCGPRPLSRFRMRAEKAKGDEIISIFFAELGTTVNFLLSPWQCAYKGRGEAMRNRGESLIQKCQETNEITFEREALSIFSRECHSYSIWHSYPCARCDWIFNFFRIWQWRNMKRGPRIITSSFSFFGVSQKEIAHNFKLWSRWKAMAAKSGRPLNWDASSAGEKWRHFAKSTLLAARGKTFHIIPFQSSLSISLLDGVNDMQLGQTSHQFFPRKVRKRELQFLLLYLLLYNPFS